MLALLLAASLAAAPPTMDSDHDGIPDVAKTSRFGPIEAKEYGLHPGRADVFIVFCSRSNVNRQALQATIERLKTFYASLPHRNRDGSTGLHMIAIVEPPLPASTDKIDYSKLYEQAMPKQWRGLAHGVLVSASANTGGQTDRPDWSGVSNDWHNIAHEVGHQFGLTHEPLGSHVQSPFHDSLMNYDYNYQFDGDPMKVHFSTGKFLRMSMRQVDLDEVVPYPARDLEFLTRPPYSFKVKPLSATSSSIDWNRNGIFSEHHVKANINDGYSIWYGDSINLGQTAGSPALASIGGDVAVVFPSLPNPSQYASYVLAPEHPAQLSVTIIHNLKGLSRQVLWTGGVAADPSAVFDGQRLWIAAPTPNGFRLASYVRSGDKFAQRSSTDVRRPPCDVTLVAAPGGVLVIVWDRASHAVDVGKAAGGGYEPLPDYTPDTGVGAVWNPIKKVLSCVAGQHLGAARKIQISDFEALPSGGWRLQGSQWVGGNASTSSRPRVLFDASRARGPNGGYDVYSRQSNRAPGSPALHYLSRQTGDLTQAGGWRTKMMGNEWATSVSDPGVAPYGVDCAYGIRWFHNELFVFFHGTGIDNTLLTDFDEVGFIFEKGLHNSLTSIQQRIWAH